MNLLYEDMNNQHDMDTYTKQIENPKISFEDYINGFNSNPNPNPNPKGMRGWGDGMEGCDGGMKGGTLLHSTPLKDHFKKRWNHPKSLSRKSMIFARKIDS